MGKKLSPTIQPDDESSRIAVAARVQQAADAQRAMETLSAAEREALVLWNGGMDYREIAERTSQSSEAVGINLTRARNRLVMAYDSLEA